MKHPKWLGAIVDQINGWLPKDPTVLDQPHRRSRITESVVPGLSFVAAGIILAIEGPALMESSGLLFGQYICMGPTSGCTAGYDAVRNDFWSGVASTIIGVAFLLLGVFVFLRKKRVNTTESSSLDIFESESQKRLAVLSLVVVLAMAVFFLAPVVPVAIHSPQGIEGTYRVCDQIESVVNGPMYTYGAYASPSRWLTGVGNIVYHSCIVSNA